MAHERNRYTQDPHRESYGPTRRPAWGHDQGAQDSPINRTWGGGQGYSGSMMGRVDSSSRNNPRDAYDTTRNRGWEADQGHGYPKSGSMDYSPRNGNRDAHEGLRHEEVPPYSRPKYQIPFLNSLSNLVGLGGHTKPSPRGSPAGGFGPEYFRPSHDKEAEFEHSKSHSYFSPTVDPRSRSTADGANGYHHGNVGNNVWESGDHIRHKSAVNEARINEMEVRNLQKEVEKLKNWDQRWMKSYAEICKDREHLKLEIEEQNIKIKKKEEDVAQLRQDLLDDTAVLAKRDAALEVKDADCKKLNDNVKELNGYLQQLERENLELKSSSEEYRRENQELKSTLQELRHENQGFKSTLQELRHENQELRSSLQERSGVNRELTSTLQELSRENHELKDNKAKQETRAREAGFAGQVDTKLLHVELKTTNDKLEANKKQLTNQVEASSKRIQELKQQISALQLQLQTNDMEMQNLRSRLRVDQEHLEQKQLSIQRLEQDLKQRNAVIEALQHEVQEPHRRNKSLTTVATAMSSDDDLEGRELEAEYSILEAQMNSTEWDAKDLGTQSREEVDRTKAQVESIESEVKDLRTQLYKEVDRSSELTERLQQRDLEIDDLKHQIQLLKRDSESVESLPPPKEYQGGDSFLETQATPYLLDKAVQRVHELAGIFARFLKKAMEQGKIDGMAVARNEFVRSQSIGKAAPLKYVLEAITCKLLFQGFENDCFELQDSTSGFLDMEEQRMENFRQYKHLCSLDNAEKHALVGDSLLTKFCRIKLANLSAAIPEIESMVKEIICCIFEQSTSEDGSTSQIADVLGTTFVKLVMSVWKVHKLSFSFNPVVRIFRVSQSEQFVERFMESVIFQDSESDYDSDQSSDYVARVDFMVVPGFFINKIVVRSRVFLVSKPLSNGMRFPNRS